MSSGTGDVHAGLASFWAAYLDETFKDYWAVEDRTLYLTLNDTNAHPNNAWPYCVYQLEGGTIISRCAAGKYFKRVQQRYQLILNVHTQDAGGVDAKTIGIQLADAIMQKLGGHRAVAPETFIVPNAEVINVILMSEYGMPPEGGQDEYMWRLNYTLDIDRADKVLNS